MEPKVEAYVKYIKEHIKDPIPMHDKTRINEMVEILSSDTSSVAEKDGAIKAIGMAALTYGTNFLKMFDADIIVEKYLTNNNPILSSQAERSVRYIKKS